MSRRPGVPQPASSSASRDTAQSTDARARSYPTLSDAQRPYSIEARPSDTSETRRLALPPISTFSGFGRSPAGSEEQNVPRQSDIYANLNPRDGPVAASLPEIGGSRFNAAISASAQYQGRSPEGRGGPTEHPQPSLTPRTYEYRAVSPRRSLGTRATSFQGSISDIQRSPSQSPYNRDPGAPLNVSLLQPSPGSTYAPHTNSYNPNIKAPSAGSGLQMRSLSASPSTTYSSYSQQSQPSQTDPLKPRLGSRQSSYTNLPALLTSGSGSGSTLGAVSPSEGERSYIGPGSYQFVTRDTVDGPVQFAVEVASGSRVADEKRKRNAGASARFRARRKEKEKEAATRISELQQHIQDLSEDADFYRRERDYFAEIVFRGADRDRHFPRAPSPRRQRAMQSQHHQLPSAVPPNYGYPELRDMENEGRTAKRRLTSQASLSNLLQPERPVLPPPPPIAGYQEFSPTERPPSTTTPQPGAPLPYHRARPTELPHLPLSDPDQRSNLPALQSRTFTTPDMLRQSGSDESRDAKPKEQNLQSYRKPGRR